VINYRPARGFEDDGPYAMIYDAFAHVPIYGLEALGFTAKGVLLT
jgi:hypothetical protein